MKLPHLTRLVSLPDGTCCHRAVEHLLKKLKSTTEVITVPSFYDGRHLLETDQTAANAALLIPDISEINAVLTEASGWSWNPDLSFPLENPPLYYAQAHKAPFPAHAGRCATIKALQPLLLHDAKFAPPRGFIFHDVHTTQEAALAAAEGEAGYCVTNEMGLNRFGLRKLIRLKHMTVYWKLFRYSPDKSSPIPQK